MPTTLDEARFRDCPHCGTRSVAMEIRWSLVLITSARQQRIWALLSCPRCAGVVALELDVLNASVPPGSGLSPAHLVRERRAIPADGQAQFQVTHLPEDVARYFNDAQRVIGAGVPDAAAVQLRRTLEAAAAHKGITERTLVKTVQKLIDLGHITTDFAGVLHHVRKVGNLGAHHTDERLSEAEVERALRFTTQVLRNLFEVPGELAELEAEAPAGESE
jgi:hypothetical protein